MQVEACNFTGTGGFLWTATLFKKRPAQDTFSYKTPPVAASQFTALPIGMETLFTGQTLGLWIGSLIIELASLNPRSLEMKWDAQKCQGECSN